MFRDARFSGYELRPVTVEVKQAWDGGNLPPRLWELVVTGDGGAAHPDSGIKPIETCEACGLKGYSSYRNGIIVDDDQWDGSDFFTVEEHRRQLLVTSRVADLIAASHLTNCILTPSHELLWNQDVPRPEDWLERERALAQKPLHELLALLDSTNPGSWQSAAKALADRLEWGVVEHLIKGFGHRDPVVVKSAELAVGRLAGHAETSQDVRDAILERLRRLLRSKNHGVRRSALNALGRSQVPLVIKMPVGAFAIPNPKSGRRRWLFSASCTIPRRVRWWKSDSGILILRLGRKRGEFWPIWSSRTREPVFHRIRDRPGGVVVTRREKVVGVGAICIAAFGTIVRVLVEGLTGHVTTQGLESTIWDAAIHGGVCVGFVIAMRYNYLFLRRRFGRRRECNKGKDEKGH